MAKKEKNKTIDVHQIDEYLLEQIQPQGGITFKDPRYILTGSGYEMCIHVYELPEQIHDHWLSKVCNINNVITTIDISTEDKVKVKQNLNKSIQEQDMRWRSAVNHQERYDAQALLNQMSSLYNEISSMGEVVKLLHIRIFVYARTRVELEDKVKTIMANLESDSFRTTVLLNENTSEWNSMFQSYKEQMENPMQMFGLPLASMAIAAGNPFHFSCLEDPLGDYLGSTPCGGNVLFDEFRKTESRLYYNSIIIGEMGSGKSTLLKKRFKARAIRGDFIRAFDVSGEFTELTYEMGGIVIRTDGSGGILNPLEILAAGDNEKVNFGRHITKVTTIYKYLAPSATMDQITEFQNTLRELYQKWNLVPESVDKKISGLPAKDYPILSELLQFIVEKMYQISMKEYNELESKVAEKQIIILDSIRSTLENIVNTYGAIFDGHTTLDNILDEQVVTFDISDIKEMDDTVFDAQLFNMVSLCWGNCVTNGTVMKKMYEEDNISWEDIVRFAIFIDESHRWINTKKLQSLELITLYMREARKYFGGIYLASQSIRDYIPEGGANSEAIDKLKTVFELTQYKFIFRQNSNTMPLLDKVFSNVLTDTQRARIPKLGQGETILSIASDISLEFKVYLTAQEEKLFSGGA